MSVVHGPLDTSNAPSDSSTLAVERCVVGVCSAIWVDKPRVIYCSTHRRQAVFLADTDFKTRLHNTASNPYSRIESFLHYKYSNMFSEELRHSSSDA